MVLKFFSFWQSVSETTFKDVRSNYSKTSDGIFWTFCSIERVLLNRKMVKFLILSGFSQNSCYWPSLSASTTNFFEFYFRRLCQVPNTITVVFFQKGQKLRFSSAWTQFLTFLKKWLIWYKQKNCFVPGPRYGALR